MFKFILLSAILAATLPGLAVAQKKEPKRIPPSLNLMMHEEEKIYTDRAENFPRAAYDSCIQGTVVINFVVTKEGRLDSFRFVHRVHPALDAYSLAFLISTDGKWNPGKLDGVPVDMRKELKIPNFFSERCPSAHDYYKQGMKLYKAEQFAEAHSYFQRAYKTDFLHLDAIAKLKETSMRLNLDCDICNMLHLYSRYSLNEIKRVRDKYCSKDFKNL